MPRDADAVLAATPSMSITDDAPAAIDAAPVLSAVVADVRDGVPAGVIGARFHHAVADLVVDARSRRATTPGTVALSGGVFQNALLLRLAVDGLARPRVSTSSPIATCRRTTAASRWVSCWSGTAG